MLGFVLNLESGTLTSLITVVHHPPSHPRYIYPFPSLFSTSIRLSSKWHNKKTIA